MDTELKKLAYTEKDCQEDFLCTPKSLYVLKVY